MTFGIIMKATNTIYFKNYTALISEAIFGIIILMGLFGWMDLLIFGKWLRYLDIEDTYTGYPNTPDKSELKYIDTEDEDILERAANTGQIIFGEFNNQLTPSIINLMIIAVFSFGNYDTNDDARNALPVLLYPPLADKHDLSS